MECEGQSPRRPHSSKFTIKFSKPCNNQDTEEIFHLTSSLGGKVSTCKKTSLTAIPSMVVHPLSSKFTDLKDVQINTEVHNVQDVKKQIMQNKVKEKRKQWAESRDTKTSAGESKQCLDEVIQRECDPQLKLSLSLPKKDILGKLDSHRGVVDESERLEINEKEVEEEEENLEPLVIEEDGDEENPATKSTEEDLSSCVSSPFTAVTKPFKIVEYRKTPSLLCCSSHKHSVVSTSSSDDDTRPWPSKSDQSDTSKTASRDDQIIKSKTSVVLEVSSAVRNRNALKSQSLDCGIDKNRTSDLNDKSMSNLEKSSVSMDDVQKELLTDHAMVQALSAECMSPYPGLFAPIPVRLKKETQETKSAEACPYVDSVPSAIEHTPANECLDTKMQSQVQRRIENIISRTARSRPSKDDRESGDIRYPRARSVTRENRSRKVHEKHSQAENERKEITSRNQRSRSVPRDTRNFRSPSLKEITSPSNGSYLSVSSTKTLAPLSPTIERVRLAKSPICQHLDMNSSTGSVITKEHINNSTLTTSDSTLHVKQKENISPCLEQQCSRSLKITLELRPRSSSLGSKSREKFRSERPRSGGNGNEKTKKLPPQFKLKLNELNNLTSFKDIQKKFSDMQYSSSPSVLESSIDPTIGGKVDKIDDLNPSKVKKLSQAFSTGALVEKKGMPTCLESANQSVTVTPAHVVHACKNVSEQVEMFQNIKDKPERVRKRSMSGTNMLKILQPLSFDSGTDSSSSSPMPTRKKNDNEVYARSNKVTSSASDQRAEFFHQKHQNPRVKFTPKVSTEQISLDTSDRDSGDMTDARTTGHSEEWFVGRDVPVVAMGTKRKIPDKLRLTTNKPSSLRLDSEDKQLFFPEMSPSTYRLKKDVKGSPTSPKKASPIERYSPLNALNRKKLEVDNLQSGKLSSSQISRFQEERKEEGNSRREKKLELLKTGRQQIQNSLDSRGLPSREGKGDSSEVTHKSKVDWKLDGQMSEKERWFSKKMYKVTNPDDNDMHVTSLYIDESVDCL
ncbi:uncharacterized protein LOC102809539, partial [Saccoglossus kowalevskii]|uniref:Microtubule-associated protein futsch-like n=1 Tax=Saccoglossus kowalevskii TaxID=10224 RepID=A0ABM0MR76_SACKO|nr:PREDICTED: microtubule-associated protein futsch-like [Saccoglossus kowalevskii]